MRLRLYSSRRGNPTPNLVAIQADELDMLPTVLVCPAQEDFPLTSLRVAVAHEGRKLIVLCELARPIHRRALQAVGRLSESDSAQVMETFRLLLAE